MAANILRHSEKPENQAGKLRRFSDYSESQTRETLAMRLRLVGRNDGVVHSSPLAGEDVAERQVRGKIGEAPEFLNPSPLIPLPQGEREKRAFTLAEVLITLGIIGVVAAMTLPTLIQNYRNQVVETRLEKFYSTINQAIRRAEVDYGDKTYWFENQISTERHKWFEKYIIPYMKISKFKNFKNAAGTSQMMIYYLPDGSAFASVNGGAVNRDWLFWPGNPDKCPNHDSSTGVCRFWFYYSPTGESWHKNKGLEPWRINASPETFYDNCKNTQYRYNCAALIQANGWKIPENYPYKVRY